MKIIVDYLEHSHHVPVKIEFGNRLIVCGAFESIEDNARCPYFDEEESYRQYILARDDEWYED